MRQISIEQLRSNISKEMGNLPFEITKNRQVMGIMCSQLDYLGDRGVNPKKITTSNYNTKTTPITGGRPTWGNLLSDSVLESKT